MTIDQRLDRLTERHEALTQSVESLARTTHEHSQQIAELMEAAARLLHVAKQVQPGLKEASLSQIVSAIGVSIPYASDIRKGRRRPHPWHWQALASLVGISLTARATDS